MVCQDALTRNYAKREQNNCYKIDCYKINLNFYNQTT